MLIGRFFNLLTNVNVLHSSVTNRSQTRRTLTQRPALLTLGIASFALGGCATAPTAYIEPAPLAAQARASHNGEVFDATWRLVNQKYFDPHFRGVSWPAMRTKYRPLALAAADDRELYSILHRMCSELRESHLTPLPPRRTHEIKTDRRTAIGMAWTILEGRRVVTSVIPSSPAANAGVLAGWQILSRDGLPLDEASTLPPQLGQPITYGFVDLTGTEREITFQPQLLKVEQLVSRALPGGFHYLRFDRFNTESLRWLSEELKKHRQAPGLVIDLRENPGGYVVAFKIAVSEFFPDRIKTGQFVTRGGRIKEEKALPILPARYTGRIVVLTSAATGSAAEIFTHVLQHQGRATVVGRRTAGAVIVSKSYPLPGGGQLQIPVQDYRGLDGRRLEGRGVIPDIGVPLPVLDDVRQGRDPDLDVALASLEASPVDPRKGLLSATNVGGTSPTNILR